MASGAESTCVSLNFKRESNNAAVNSYHLTSFRSSKATTILNSRADSIDSGRGVPQTRGAFNMKKVNSMASKKIIKTVITKPGFPKKLTVEVK